MSTVQMWIVLLCVAIVTGVVVYLMTRRDADPVVHEEFVGKMSDRDTIKNNLGVNDATENVYYTASHFPENTFRARLARRNAKPYSRNSSPSSLESSKVTNQVKYCMNIHCTMPQTPQEGVIHASVRYSYRDADYTDQYVHGVVKTNFTIQPQLTNSRLLKTELPMFVRDEAACKDDSCAKDSVPIDPATVTGEIRIVSIQLDAMSLTTPLLVESVTITKEARAPKMGQDDGCNSERIDSDDTDGEKHTAQKTTTYQGLMTPFALYTPGETLNAWNGIWEKRPMAASFVIGMSNSEFQNTYIYNVQTRVFRGKLTLLGEDQKYPDKLRLVFLCTSSSNPFPTSAALTKNTFNWSDPKIMHEYRPRTCTVDIDVRKRGMGAVYEFHISLASTDSDILVMYPFCDDPARKNLPEILLQFTPLSATDKVTHMPVLPKSGENEWKNYKYGPNGQILPFDYNSMQSSALCSVIHIPAWLSRRSTVIDFLMHQKTGSAETVINGVGCAGKGFCMYGKCVVNTSALSSSPETLVKVDLQFVTGRTIEFHLTRQKARILLGQDGQDGQETQQREELCSITTSGRSIGASTEIIYAFTIYENEAIIMVSAFGSTHARKQFNTGLLRLKDHANYPEIVRAQYHTYDAVDAQSCNLCTELQGTLNKNDFHRSDKIAVLEQDVRGCAAPLFHSWRLKNLRVHLTKSVRIRHMSLVLFLHTWLLRYIHVYARHQNAAPSNDIIIASYGSINIRFKNSQLVLVIPNRNKDVVLVKENYIKNTDAMLQISITHPGKLIESNYYEGHLCIEQTSTWTSKWGQQETKVLPIDCHSNSPCPGQPGISYAVKDETYSHLTVNGMMVVYAMQMGKALPHKCGEEQDFTPLYPHHTSSSLNKEMQKMMQDYQTTQPHRMEQLKKHGIHDGTFELSIQSPQQRREQSQGYKLIKKDHECATPDTNLHPAETVQKCAQKCREQNGCKYFIYGKGKKDKNCYWESSVPDEGCPKWESDDYDFYEVV